MAGKFGGYEDEEDDVLAPKEPQVTSQDPDERKSARALRIKRRQEALKKAEQPAEEAAFDEEPGEIEKATAAAAVELQRLALDGAAKVTNVKVTTDEREVIRREQFFGKMRGALQKIEDEATEAQLKYEAISANWETMLSIQDPLDIDAEMKEQKKKCDELLDQKNEMIAQLKSDLKRMDEAYYEDLEKQDKDIKELSDRIEKQVTIMQRAYEKQLGLIEVAINYEREVMVDHNNKRWEALYKQRDREETAHLEQKFEQLEEHKQEVEAIMWDHHEKYREAKIELETLIQDLQRELEKLKAVCIINTEKIGYTYQVLKKREEENVFVRSQQKRKLNKMSDVANALRSKIRKAAEDGAAEEIRADTEIVKLMQTMDDLEKKSNQFSHVNHYKFSQIWRMAAARCMELNKLIRQGEVALHAHILAEPAPPPPPPPPKSPLSKYEHEAAEKSAQANVRVNTEIACTKSKSTEAAKEKLIRHILQLVADNTGFLVEDRLLKLIEKFQQSSRNLCTLDAIFMALEIQAEEDIDLLCKTFLNYAFCPVCVGIELESDVMRYSTSNDEYAGKSSREMRGDRSSTVRGRASIVRSMSASTSRSTHILRSYELTPSDHMLIAEADEIIQKCGDPQATGLATTAASEGSSMTGKRTGTRGVTVAAQPTGTIQKPINPFLCPMGHHLEMEPMQVLTALSEFIAVFVPPEKQKLYDILDSVKPPSFDTPSRRLSADEIQQYWAQWKNVFPAEKDRFWDGLLTGLNNYLTILQDREQIHNEVDQLRRRNAALRRLIRGVLPELPSATRGPRYTGPYPQEFTATIPDEAPKAYARLPPI